MRCDSITRKVSFKSDHKTDYFKLCFWLNKLIITVVTNLVANLLSGVSIGNCIYKLTDQGDFNQARSECKSYGGDLIHRNFGPSGAAYHELVKSFVNHTVYV